MPNDTEIENLREFYRRDFFVKKMTGEMPDLVKFSMKMRINVGFVMNLNRGEVWGIPIGFNDITGRITVRGGGKRAGEGWVRSFLIRQVKMFTFSAELYDEWERTK